MDDTRRELAARLALEQLKLRIFKLYGMDIDSVKMSDYGTGSLTYFITCNDRKYVVKYASENTMNHPEIEPQVCAHLLKKGIPVCRKLNFYDLDNVAPMFFTLRLSAISMVNTIIR